MPLPGGVGIDLALTLAINALSEARDLCKQDGAGSAEATRALNRIAEALTPLRKAEILIEQGKDFVDGD